MLLDLFYLCVLLVGIAMHLTFVDVFSQDFSAKTFSYTISGPEIA